MCRRVECSRCERPTYAGCGAHLERVLRDVPPGERCRCREEKPKGGGALTTTRQRPWFRSPFAK
jgi:hypothetical protein